MNSNKEQECCSESLEKHIDKVSAILDKYDKNPRKLIPILQKIQDECKYLPQSVMEYVATSLNVPASAVFGVATFYSHFALTPRGKHSCKICDGTACHVKGSQNIIDGVREHLGLEGKESTTSDMMFTVDAVACVGACGLAPVVLIDERVYGQTNAKAIVDALKEISSKGGDKDDAN